MRTTQYVAALAVIVLLAGPTWAQAGSNSKPDNSGTSSSKPWSFSLTADGYVVPHAEFFLSPIATADRGWLHLEARYNYENLYTGSLWVGYNVSFGKTLSLSVTPMIGGVLGRTNGVAPGCEASLTYKKVEASVSNEYVFDTASKAGNFYYAWPQLTFSPIAWFRVGAVAQRTKVYHTPVNIQRGFLVGFSHKPLEFTTYVFNPQLDKPTVVLEVGASF